MHASNFVNPAIILASLFATSCLTKPISDVPGITNAGTTNISSLADGSSGPSSIADPAEKVVVGSEAIDTEQNIVVITRWRDYMQARLLETGNAVKLFGYNSLVPDNKFIEQFTKVSHSTQMSFNVTKAEGAGVPGLTWGTVWDTCRYLRQHLDSYRIHDQPNFLPALRFTVTSIAGMKTLAVGEVLVIENRGTDLTS